MSGDADGGGGERECGCGGDCGCGDGAGGHFAVESPAPDADDAETGDPEEGPPDPQLAPTRSPGFGESPDGLDDVEVSRDDVTIGEATPEELTASDVEPVADEPTRDLLAALRADDAVARRRAALALGDRDGDREAIVAGLVAALEGDDDADVRQFAVESLAKVGGERAGRAARDALDDPDQWVRAEAVVALDRIDRGRHADAVEAALDDDHHAPRRNAAISLFKLRGEDALATLLDAADDPSPRVREWGAHLLGGIDDDRARDRLRRLAAEDDSDVVRKTADWALDADPGAFRRNFVGPMDERERTLPGEDLLNRQPPL